MLNLEQVRRAKMDDPPFTGKETRQEEKKIKIDPPKVSLSPFPRRHDTQHNDIQHNGTWPYNKNTK